MKMTPGVTWKYLLLACAFVGPLSPWAHAQQAVYKPLVFIGEAATLNTSLVLPAGCYQGAGPLTVRAEKGQRTVLEITETTVLESAKIMLQEGTQLRARGALLRDCHIYAQPGAEVVLESCALERFEIGGDTSKTKSPTSVRVTNCVFQGGAWLSSANRIGLEMSDCIIRDQLATAYVLRLAISAESPPLSFARRPSVRFTKFENCYIHPSLLLTVSQVTMEKCQSVQSTAPLFASTAAPGSPPEATLPLRWVDCQPEAPPQVGAGVALQRLTDPISGGCTLAARAEGGRLILEKTVAATPVPLKNVLPVADASQMASSGGGNSAGNDRLSDAERARIMGTPESLKVRQAHVNGLLVMQLSSGQTAGSVTKMNVTAVPGGASLRFSQSVGEDMLIALREVNKFIQLRHKLPGNSDLEIAFEEKYSDKDGPSAAVACTMLVESIMTGKLWDTTFAVTGDMNADGAVQPVGGVAAKVRGATKGSCKIVAVPARNESAIGDILVSDGPAPLVGIHIFGIEKFDQATALGSSVDRPAALQQAVDEFDVIRGVLMRDPRQISMILRTPQAVARLQAVLEKAPHSLSAKYLLMYAQNRAPNALSLSGSLEAADSNALSLVRSIETDFKGAVGTLKQDELGGALNRLRNLRPRTDPRVWPYLDALVDYGEVVRSEVLNPARTAAKFNEMASKARQAASVVVSAQKSIMADPKVREDLGL